MSSLDIKQSINNLSSFVIWFKHDLIASLVTYASCFFKSKLLLEAFFEFNDLSIREYVDSKCYTICLSLISSD